MGERLTESRENNKGYYIPGFVSEADVKAFNEYPAPMRGLGSRAAMFVIDMTHAFVEDQYPYGFSRTGIPCTENIGKLLMLARQSRIPIFYTRTDRRSKALENIVDANSYKARLNRELNACSNEIMESIAPAEGDIVIEKSAPSAFFGTPLAALLNRLRIDSIIVTGMTTSGCVRATAVDAFSYKYRIIVPIECVADRSQISHEVTLFDLSMKYAHVMHLSDLAELLEREQAAD
jgi:maleamate amidohydrolase